MAEISPIRSKTQNNQSVNQLYIDSKYFKVVFKQFIQNILRILDTYSKMISAGTKNAASAEKDRLTIEILHKIVYNLPSTLMSAQLSVQPIIRFSVHELSAQISSKHQL